MNRICAVVATAVITLVAISGRAAEPTELKGHTKAVSAIAWAADGKSLATASVDRSIRVWDPTTGKQTGSLTSIAREGFGGPVVAFTADLMTVAVNYWGEVIIRTVADNKELLRFDPLGPDRGQKSAFRPDVFAMAYSPDGKRLATAGSRAAVGGRHGLPGGVVTIWNAETGKAIHRFDTLSTAASSVTWSQDGKQLVSGSSGAGGELQEAGRVYVWDSETGKELHNFSVKPKTEYGEWASAADVAMSPDGKWVVVPITAGSRAAPAGIIIEDTGAAIGLWELATGKATQPVKGLKAAVGRAIFSPDGKRLAATSRDKIARVWELETGKELVALNCPDAVVTVAFSPDGKSVAAGCKDGSVRIWATPK